MNSRLVIHPKDRSTEFLARVYDGLDATVITGGVSKNTLRHMVEDFDQVLMMGHGSASGLMSVGQFKDNGVFGNIVDHSFDAALAKKDNSVFIWCNADQFVNRGSPFLPKLNGFYTGMFISEIYEAYYNKVDASMAQIDESNEAFARIMNDALLADPRDLYWNAKTRYGALAIYNPVAAYNYMRLYVNHETKVTA